MSGPDSVLSEKEIQKILKSTAQLDEDPSKPCPATYLPALRRHLQTNPDDSFFLIEFARPHEPGNTDGGNGYGLVTCRCSRGWADVRHV
jgi:hypothetical protein